MTRDNITDIKIETRSEDKYWNVCMFVDPDVGSEPSFKELVALAEDVIRKAKCRDRKWHARSADVMLWSSIEKRGAYNAYECRVTLDMTTSEIDKSRDGMEYGQV